MTTTNPLILDDVRKIERLGAAAWAPAQVELLDGWRLRFNDGVTRRANSVWASECDNRLPLGTKIDLVEEAYRRRGLVPTFQISPTSQPDELDEVLAGRGYAAVYRTCTQIAAVDAVINCTSIRSNRVDLNAAFDETWLDTYCRAEGVGERDAHARRGILTRCPTISAYALAHVDGVPVATGWAVAGDDWVGIFSVATRPEFRRRGAASAILHRIALWAQHCGAANLYLQVLEDNSAAHGLYTQAGFTTLYRYHYREAPAAEQG